MQESSIADLAKATLGHWKKVWAHHVHVLLDPAFLADPRAEAKAVLKAITEQVGAEKRRREPKTPMLTMRPQVRLQAFCGTLAEYCPRIIPPVPGSCMLLGTFER